MDRNDMELLDRCIFRAPDRDEALRLFRSASADPEVREQLYQAARLVRKAETGDRFRITGGISGVLSCELRPLCLYCPYWREAGKTPQSTQEIVDTARHYQELGIDEFHLSGGTTLGSRGEDIYQIVKAIYDAGLRGLRITVNCGAAMSVDTMRALKEMGVYKVGAVFEIAEPEQFKRLKPGDDLALKTDFAWKIREAGLVMHSGIMAGLGPRESRFEDYVTSIFFMKQFPHLAGLYISKFRPMATTPMRDHPPCSQEEACILVAVTRLVLRRAEIRLAFGWSGEESEQGYQAGAGNELCALMMNGKGQPIHDRRDELRQLAARIGVLL